MTRSAAVVTVPWDSECADIPHAPAALLRELGVVMTPFSMSSLASASVMARIETTRSPGDTGLPLSSSAIASPSVNREIGS